MKVPLSERMRPTSFDEVVGQDHLFRDHGWIAKLIENKTPLSLLLWSPPGTGKTTIARLYAKAFSSPFFSFTAVMHSITEIKELIQKIKQEPLFYRQPIIFVDEIHRFNRAQQDLFLPFLENGTIILIGATTENPSFAINNALLSRMTLVALKPLEEQALFSIITRYETQFRPLPLTKEAKEMLVALSQGDARYLLNAIEKIESVVDSAPLDSKELSTLLQRKAPLYDKSGDYHYDLISALHKSVRGSDPDAALYWLARMLEGGEDPLFICRRMIRMAIEDIGLADPQALGLTQNVQASYERLGSPEGELALAQAIIYLALAPKSNALYNAFAEAQEAAKKTTHLSPPKTILNAPTKLMRNLGWGKDYLYDHDLPHAFSGQRYFPEEMERECFYRPVERGFEREMKKRLEYFTKLREEKNLPTTEQSQ